MHKCNNNNVIRYLTQLKRKSSHKSDTEQGKDWHICYGVSRINCTTRLCGLVVRVPGYRSRGPWFDSRRYQIFWEVVGLERGPLSFVRIIEELLEWKSSGSGQQNRINDRGDPLLWPRDTLYPQKLDLTSPTSDGRSVGIVRLRTKGHGVLVLVHSSTCCWRDEDASAFQRIIYIFFVQ
jgi:hypothetical protein